METASRFLLQERGLQALLDALGREGYAVHGPRVRDGAIVYDEILGIEDLPRSVSDEQAAGAYRLRRRDDTALFGHAAGPHSWKKYLHPPIQRLWRATRDGGQLKVEAENGPPAKIAFLGVRACDLHAIAIQDRVFMQGSFVDAGYRARREAAFIIAVQCGAAAETCFCVSMGTGPAADGGYDLVLTELPGPTGSRFIVAPGSQAGARMLEALPKTTASEADLAEAAATVERTARSMARAMPDVDLRGLLQGAPTHPRWDDVAARCLSCANCTMVCPTCFCTSVEETSDLAGVESARVRRWDSCFTTDFSYMHGGSVRTSPKARYRQWMTHKLANWFDQFGTSGCVGCGRCITWCPAGIDITEEAHAMCEGHDKGEASHGKP